MGQPTVDRRTAGVIALVALAVVAVLVMRTSSAAFTASTVNDNNSFVAGDVSLSNDATASAAMFTETVFVPGQTAVECITVTYDGSIADPGPVRLYSGGYTDIPGPDAASTGLSPYLILTIEEGSGAGYGNCGAFISSATIVTAVALSTFDTNRTDYASGAGVWDPSATPQSRSYRFSVTLDEGSVPNEEQGAGTNNIGFVWEVTS